MQHDAVKLHSQHSHSTKTMVQDAKSICLTFSLSLSGIVSRFKAMCRWSSIHWSLRKCSSIHYCDHKGPPLDPVPDCIISIYIHPSILFLWTTSPIQMHLGLPGGPLLSNFPTKTVCTFPKHATRPVISPSLI